MRRPPTAQTPRRAVTTGPRRTLDLDPDEALRLLGSTPLGRIVFTEKALPAIRPVNHIVDDGQIVIRTHEGAALVAHAREAGDQGVVVAYEADVIDLETRLGWTVVATGYCRIVTDPGDVTRYRAMIDPWSDQHMDYVVRIQPDLVTGVRLAPVPE
nr:pyridoxamine 5'-phosphate oxidase family protein [Streptomyces bambusae]